MTTIQKYPLKTTGENEVQLPIGAQILHAGIDHQGSLSIWAMVDMEKPLESRGIFVAGTGLGIPDDGLCHIESCVQGRCVWHVFSRVNDNQQPTT